MPPGDAPTQLLAPAAVGQAGDGTEVFHTGLWLDLLRAGVTVSAVCARRLLYRSLSYEQECQWFVVKSQVVATS